MAPASGMIPSGISGRANSTCSAAMMRSEANAISNPPPMARPFKAAMTGLLRFHISVSPAKPPGTSDSLSHQLSSCCSPLSSAFKSQPAEKIRSPPPVRIATLSSGSSRRRAKASPSRRLVAWSMAFTFGRSSVTSRTAPRRSTLTSSPMTSISLAAMARVPGMAWKH